MEDYGSSPIDPLEAIIVHSPFTSSQKSVVASKDTYRALIEEIMSIQRRVILYRDHNKEGMYAYYLSVRMPLEILTTV
jgi:hypothetical protein